MNVPLTLGALGCFRPVLLESHPFPSTGIARPSIMAPKTAKKAAKKATKAKAPAKKVAKKTSKKATKK